VPPELDLLAHRVDANTGVPVRLRERYDRDVLTFSLPRAELERRAAEAHELLGERCVVCPRGCKVDRRADVAGLCAIGRHAVVASYFPHFGEEDCLRGQRGSGTIFFSGCNLRCVFCVAPGSLVATEHGPTPIDEIFSAGLDEIVVGDGRVRRRTGVRVHTVNGDLARVAKAFEHPYHGDLVRLKPMSAPEVRLTPNHEVFAAHRDVPERLVKIPAGELTEEHYLVVPKRAVGVRTTLDVARLLAQQPVRRGRRRARRIEHERLREALASRRTSREVAGELGYHPTYVRTLRSRLARGRLDIGATRPLTLQVEGGLVRFAGERRPGIPAELPLDEGLAWLLGLYCAEGHVTESRSRPNSRRLVFSLGLGESVLAARAASLLEGTFGVHAQLVERRTTMTVEVGKSALALLLKSLCGSGAQDKRVPAPILAASESPLRAFLDGYLSGDGTETRTHFVGQTVSRELAHGLYELGLRLDVLPSIHHWQAPEQTIIEGRAVRQRPLWYVKFKKDRLAGGDLTRERTRWRDEGSHFLVPLLRIEREPYQGPVYNLEVDHPTHSYLAPAVAIGNCQNHDISWQLRGELVTPERLAGMMLELQAIGCHNINWVTPEHVVPQILEALPLAFDRGLDLPIVYNSSSYDSLDSLHLLEGIVDIYMPDFKLWTNEAAKRYLKRADYPDVARDTIVEMNRQVGDLVLDDRGLAQRGLILRHLIMPGLLDETESILRFVAEELGTGTYVNLMAQYYVSGKVGENGQYEEIARGIHREEYEQALALARELGLRLDPRSVGERRLLARAV
jgi:putative pyruvate formate lyase activating enzyme